MEKYPQQCPRRLVPTNCFWSLITSLIPNCYSIFLLNSPSPFSPRVSHIIYPLLNDLGPPFVNHPSHYLSVCHIGHPLWLFMSWDSQGSTVQRFSSHKCGQKVSYRAFNAVAATFPWIPLSLHPSCTFIIYVPISRTSW